MIESESRPTRARSDSESSVVSDGGTSSIMLQDFEDRLKRAAHFAQELEAMLLIAQREREDALARQANLKAENMQLRTKLGSRRAPGSSAMRGGSPSVGPRLIGFGGSEANVTARRRRPSHEDADDDNVYDWVCEITKLSDVGTSGWTVRYSSRFLASLNEADREMVMGEAPVNPVVPEEEEDEGEVRDQRRSRSA